MSNNLITLARDRATLFPTLVGLGLGPNELNALERQGFVSRERRRDLEIYKLRYRVGGRQRVKYVRAVEVVAVVEELNRLQACVRLEKQSRATAHEARVLLRMTKLEVSARAAELGLTFHGFSIRRPRRRKARDSVGELSC